MVVTPTMRIATTVVTNWFFMDISLGLLLIGGPIVQLCFDSVCSTEPPVFWAIVLRSGSLGEWVGYSHFP